MTSSEQSPSKLDHITYLKQALDRARRSPPKPSNFRVGCILVSNQSDSSPQIISTGYTLELLGNTHAEQCALSKLISLHSKKDPSIGESESVSGEDWAKILPPELNVTLYTTLEPCGKRLSGNLPCVQRIINTRKGNPDGGVRKVVFGAKEPGTFVQDSQSCRLLTEAGIEWDYIPDIEKEILGVAMEGHKKDGHDQRRHNGEETGNKQSKGQEKKVTNIDDISEEEWKRQQALPRNPKKRMMEFDPATGE